MNRRTFWTGVAVGAGLLSGAAQAAFVAVGNPGNAADTTGDPNPCGSVAYSFEIGQFEVTAGEWRNFLNAADPTGANALGLYNSEMDSNEMGCQITLVPGNPAGAKYDFSGRPSGDESDWVNRPVNYVSWNDAARYCNWLTTGNTERGVYDTTTWSALPHDTAGATLGVLVTYFLPTQDEWYKAAYYDPNKGGAGVPGYWDYPTKSDIPNAPGRDMTEAANPGNNANYYSTSYLIGAPYYRTEVGEFQLSTSPYGTFDQGGNVWEWNETAIAVTNREVRGGTFQIAGAFPNADALRSDKRNSFPPATEFTRIGFRVALARSPARGTVIYLR